MSAYVVIIIFIVVALFVLISLLPVYMEEQGTDSLVQSGD